MCAEELARAKTDGRSKRDTIVPLKFSIYSDLKKIP